MAFLRSIFGRGKGKMGPDSQASAQQIARTDTLGLVFIGSMDGKLRALDALTGSQIWEFDAGGWLETTPASWDGLLIATSWNLQTGVAGVFALEVHTGTKVWESQPDWGETSSPAIVGGVVIIGCANNNLYALDARTGRQVWEFATKGAVRGSPTVSEGFVFVGSDDGNVYALSVSSGVKVWQFPTRGRVWCSPAVGGGLVLFGSDDGKVHAVEMLSGTKVWAFEAGEAGLRVMDGKMVMSYPAVWQDLVFAASMDEKVYALELTTGRMVWNFDAGDVVSPPAVWEDLVIVGSLGFYALEARTGRQAWKFEADMLTTSAPAIWRDRVFVVGSGPPLSQPPDIDVPVAAWRGLGLVGCRLYALDARTGKQVWGSRHTTEGDMSAPSVWEDGKLDWPMYRGNPQHTGMGVQATDT